MSGRSRSRQRRVNQVDGAGTGATAVSRRGHVEGLAAAEYAVTLGALAGLLGAVWSFARAWLPAMRGGVEAAAAAAGARF